MMYGKRHTDKSYTGKRHNDKFFSEKRRRLNRPLNENYTTKSTQITNLYMLSNITD